MIELDTGLAAARLSDVPAAARAVEAAGFKGLWTAETSHDPYLPLALAAEHSSRVDLGTSIAVAFPRSPLVHAMLAWDLQSLSGGRVILGLGTQVKGHNEKRFGIPWESPGPRLREMIQMIRAAWDCFQNGTPPTFAGKFYRFQLMTPFFNPGPIEHPAIPIYIAGVNPYMCRLAGELCDGFHVHPLHSVRYVREAVLPQIAAGAAAAGRDVAQITLTSSCFTIAGDTPREQEGMRQLVRSQISFYASTPAYRPVFELHGWGEVAARLTTLSRTGDWAGMAALVTDEMLDVFAITSSWDELPGRLRERYDGLFQRLNLYIPYRPQDPPERWRRLAESLRA